MNPFRSARLEYRAIESPADDAVIQWVYSDPETFSMASATLSRPFSRAMAAEIMKGLQDGTMLAVVICKLPEEEEVVEQTEQHQSDTPRLHQPARQGSDSNSGGRGPAVYPVGYLALKSMDPGRHQHRCSDLMIAIAREHQGNGYGPEAIEWALNWAFESAALHRVGLVVYSYNERARRVYEKLGFALEGRVRESIWKNGRWWDLLHMGILDCEWTERRDSRRISRTSVLYD